MERLYRKLEEYSRSDYYPFHMPGHKRNPESVKGDFPFERDITEIEGFDNLHHPEDILLEAQQNVAKLDGTAKGGIAVAIQSELDIPVKYIGVGETIDDLQKFDADAFVNALFDIDEKDLHTEE